MKPSHYYIGMDVVCLALKWSFNHITMDSCIVRGNGYILIREDCALLITEGLLWKPPLSNTRL